MSAWVDDVREAQDTLHVLVQQQTSLGDQLLKHFPSQHVLRIFQLDALQLEGEVITILKTALNKVLSIEPLERFRFHYPDELQLALQIALFKFGVWDTNQSVWDRMQNLIYRNERTVITAAPLAVVWTPGCAPTRWQKIGHLCLTSLLPYVFRKVMQRALEENWAAEGGWKARWYRWLRWVQAAAAATKLVHMLVFFMEGKYRTLADRLLGMRLVHGDQQMRRLVNLAYLNQYVSWSTWSSFLQVLLPLLRVGQMWDSVSSVGGSFLANVSSGQVPLREGYCNLCREPAVLGVKSNCGHLFCYHCLQSRVSPSHNPDSGRSFPCPACGAAVSHAVS